MIVGVVRINPYRSGLKKPTAGLLSCAACSFAIAIKPAHIGAEKLVPPQPQQRLPLNRHLLIDRIFRVEILAPAPGNAQLLAAVVRRHAIENRERAVT